MDELKGCILVIDDDEPMLRLAEAALASGGHQVLTASTGEEALALAVNPKEPVDLLLVDVVLPDINGPELAERLKELQPAARVIFTSGFGGAAEAALERRSDFVAPYIAKPFGISELRATVQKALHAAPGSSLVGIIT